jgi:hypothetical protein
LFIQTLVQNYTKKLKSNYLALITIVNNNYIAVLAIAFNRLAKGNLTKRKHYTKIKVFVTSLVNINKALANKAKTNLYTKLLKHFYKFLNVYSCTNVNKLLLIQRKGINYKIIFKKENSCILKVL